MKPKGIREGRMGGAENEKEREEENAQSKDSFRKVVKKEKKKMGEKKEVTSR